MALNQIMIMSLIVLMNSCKESAAMCPEPLRLYNCSCLPMDGGMWNITCKGDDVAQISRELPETTIRFTYIACERFVQLGNTNFTRIQHLRYLSINDCGDNNVLERRIYPMPANDRMFEHLHELRELRIHINWAMQTVLPNLFVNLTHLEVLDLSNTRLINLDNLIASFEGLRQSVNLTVLNLWNIKTMQHSSPNLELQLDKLLEPLSNSSLEVLNLGYNSFRSITPGIIQFAPRLKRLIVRNNVLIPVITCSLMTEALLHKTLEEADVSEQGFRPVHYDSDWYMHGGYGLIENENTMMSKDHRLISNIESEIYQRNINRLNQDIIPGKERLLLPHQPNDDTMNLRSDLKNPDNENQQLERKVRNILKQEGAFPYQPKYEDPVDVLRHVFEKCDNSNNKLKCVSEYSINDGRVNKLVGNITASPISRSGSQSIIKDLFECVILLYKDTCNFFQPVCKQLKQLLIDKHELFCDLLNFFFQWHFTGVHCNYIPPIDDLIQENCGACLVIPSVGNIRKFFVSNLNIYDQVLMYVQYRDKPLCFHPHSAIEYIDISGNMPYGYPESRFIFQHDIRGLGNLTFLNASRLGVDNFYTNLTTSFPNLRTLDASHNQITLSESKSILAITQSVENLDLSYNQISQVAEKKFVKLYSLKQLDLSNNFIPEFSVDLADSTGLEFLGLATNRLTSLPESIIQQLNDIALANSSQPFRVNLAGNNLICTCATKPFMEWILHSHPTNLVFTDVENYTCSNRYSDKVALQKVTMYSINRECYEPILYACAGAAGAVFLFLLGITYNRRWYLRHRWYIFTRDVARRGYVNTQHEYAAYICFNSDDDDVRNWVVEDIRQQLNKFQFFYGHESVEIGHDINQELEGNLNKCYRSILVLTPTFVANPNLMYEVNIIVDKLKDSGADSLIVIVRKPLRRIGLDPTLKLLMERHLCLEWVEDNTDAHNYFWERLKDVIGSPCRELYDRSESRGNHSGDADDDSALIQQA